MYFIGWHNFLWINIILLIIFTSIMFISNNYGHKKLLNIFYRLSCIEIIAVGYGVIAVLLNAFGLM
ncbi:TPA: hypothetical protein LA742_002253 [Clostridium botulinum]|uniref:hypothetical protein n=1 Tax=Clostridium sporogenes TaxID=1509 RepID=UPI00077356B6|nr:hypothetical protein [Clostridium sporogenes]AUM93854.1 hypothetical protein RSJ11_01225 [Clostridium sporogenes]HBJ2613779.1 hypothetical protein [Clostridium botulinum]